MRIFRRCANPRTGSWKPDARCFCPALDQSGPAGCLGTGTSARIDTKLHDSPVLDSLPDVAEAIRIRRPPTAARFRAKDPLFGLFSGTVHFAQRTFRTSGHFVVPTADMNQIVEHAKHAVVSISDYAAQYGVNVVTVTADRDY